MFPITAIIISGLIAAGAGLASSGISAGANYGLQKDSQAFTAGENQLSRQWSSQENQLSREHQLYMAQNAYQMQRKDMEAAGINPATAGGVVGLGSNQSGVSAMGATTSSSAGLNSAGIVGGSAGNIGTTALMAMAMKQASKHPGEFASTAKELAAKGSLEDLNFMATKNLTDFVDENSTKFDNTGPGFLYKSFFNVFNSTITQNYHGKIDQFARAWMDGIVNWTKEDRSIVLDKSRLQKAFDSFADSSRFSSDGRSLEDEFDEVFKNWYK